MATVQYTVKQKKLEITIRTKVIAFVVLNTLCEYCHVCPDVLIPPAVVVVLSAPDVRTTE